MKNNYLKVMPSCPLCHSINVGFNQNEVDTVSEDVFIESYICGACGYSWEEVTEYEMTTYPEGDEDYWYIPKEIQPLA